MSDNEILLGANHPGACATRDADGSFALAYLPQGGAVSMAANSLSGQTLNAHWFDPRTGTTTFIARSARGATHTFEAPSHGAGHD